MRLTSDAKSLKSEILRRRCRSKPQERGKFPRIVENPGKQSENLLSGFDITTAPQYYAPRSHDSSVVQSVERRTVNPYVTGSSPVRGAKFEKADIPGYRLFYCFFFISPNYVTHFAPLIAKVKVLTTMPDK